MPDPVEDKDGFIDPATVDESEMFSDKRYQQIPHEGRKKDGRKKPKTRQEISRTELERRMETYKAEANRLKQIVIAINPDLLKEGAMAPPVEAYTVKLNQRIMAYARTGMLEDEWIAAFGVSRGEWENWKELHSGLVKIVEKAEMACTAWWHAQARDAMLSNNTRFSMPIYRAALAAQAELEEKRKRMSDGSESAAQLVQVHIGLSKSN